MYENMTIEELIEKRKALYKKSEKFEKKWKSSGEKTLREEVEHLLQIEKFVEEENELTEEIKKRVIQTLSKL